MQPYCCSPSWSKWSVKPGSSVQVWCALDLCFISSTIGCREMEDGEKKHKSHKHNKDDKEDAEDTSTKVRFHVSCILPTCELQSELLG